MEGKTITQTVELHYFPSTHKPLSLLLPHFFLLTNSKEE